MVGLLYRMLINTELLRALRAAGGDDETAAAAAAVLADQERRLNRLEFMARVAPCGLIASLGLIFALLLIIVVRA